MNRKSKIIKLKYKKTRLTKHGNYLILLFIKNILKKGKEYLALRIIHKVLFLLEYKFKCNSIKIIEQAVCNSQIDFKLNNSNILIEIDLYRSASMAIKNIITITKQRSKFSLVEKLFYAIIEAYYCKGEAVKKHQETITIANTYKLNLENDDHDYNNDDDMYF